MRRLQFSRAALVGTVITRFDARSTYGYGYGYGYGCGYGYGYGNDPAAKPALAHAEEAHRPKLTNARAEG